MLERKQNLAMLHIRGSVGPYTAAGYHQPNARFDELGINLGIVNPRLVAYPEFIPGTTFCVLSTL